MAALRICPLFAPGAPTTASKGVPSSLSSSAVVSSASARAALLPGTRISAVACQAGRSQGARVVCKVSVGDTVPAVTLLDQSGKSFSLSKLKGKNVVLYFYPADDTPGCTKQACSFRDSFDVFKSLGAEVVGISGDSPESHKAFAAKHNLPYTLLSDEGNVVRKDWGVPSDLFGALPGRQTYVIDKKGIVRLVFNNQFQPEKHIAETTRLLETLAESDKEEAKAGGFRFPKLF